MRGQGGEFHINEQPLSFWQELFEARGYRAYDCVRPHLRSARKVAPWYRFNSILYVNEMGRVGLPDVIADTEITAGRRVQDGGDLMWRLRRGVVSFLPRGTVTRIAQARAGVLAKRAETQNGRSSLSA